MNKENRRIEGNNSENSAVECSFPTSRCLFHKTLITGTMQENTFNYVYLIWKKCRAKVLSRDSTFVEKENEISSQD